MKYTSCLIKCGQKQKPQSKAIVFLDEAKDLMSKFLGQRGSLLSLVIKSYTNQKL